MTNHGLSDGPMTYEDVQRYFMANLPHDTSLFNEFHALIVKLCQTYCGKTPRCALYFPLLQKFVEV